MRNRSIIIKSNKKFLASTTKSVLCTVHIVTSSRGCVPMSRDSLLAGFVATEEAEHRTPIAAILRSVTRHQWHAADPIVFPVWEIICHYICHKEEAVACWGVFFHSPTGCEEYSRWCNLLVLPYEAQTAVDTYLLCHCRLTPLFSPVTQRLHADLRWQAAINL